MNRRKRFLAAFVLAFSLAVVGGLVFLSVSAASPESPPPEALVEGSSGFDGNVRLTPPATDAQPKISADEAAAAALAGVGADGGKVTRATLASFSWDAVPVDENDTPKGAPLYDEDLAWIVTVDGVCSQLVPETGECVNAQMNAVVDAETGEFLIAFAAEQDLVTKAL